MSDAIRWDDEDWDRPRAGDLDAAPYCHTIGETRGPRAARVRGRTVERTREDGALDWYTVHLTKRGARRAAALYERTGKVRGTQR